MVGGLQTLRDCRGSITHRDIPNLCDLNSPWRSYFHLKVKNLGTVCHSGFDEKLIFKILSFRDPHCTSTSNLDVIRQRTAEPLTI